MSDEKVYWLWAYNCLKLHGSKKCANSHATGAYSAERFVTDDTSMYNVCCVCGHLAEPSGNGGSEA